MDYRETLNLPRTDFPMRARLPQREPEVLEFWEQMGLYAAMWAARHDRQAFILHDGPPYANGEIHIGTALNKILKDIINRFAFLDGFDIPYVPGWDTHGLPIEHKAILELGIDDWRHIDPVELRNKCREFALKYVQIMTGQFRRLGVVGDWEHPYITLTPGYEAEQVKVFGEMAKQGFIYRGLKPVYWCADCETALAEAEVEYADKTSPSIYVAFPVRDGRGILPQEDTCVVIWTTTPWTLPANTAITLHPDFDYALVATEKGSLLLAADLVDQVLGTLGLEGRVTKTFPGARLEGILCRHPFYDRDSLVILGDHVTREEGTGCVHTAPGHGREDFEVGQRYGVETIQPLDDRGYFTAAAPGLEGVFYQDGNGLIIDRISKAGYLLQSGKVVHQYAHCWRCKHPLLWRATRQWFASVEGFRPAALAAIDQVSWVPSWGRERIRGMVADRSDWCISRQRVWGVPIPIFHCGGCGRPVVNDTTIGAVADLFRREGSNAWFQKDAADILPAGYQCPDCGGGEWSKETDIMDVWFDSGSSHAAVLGTRKDLAWPADMYLEGSDQHRGWFQSSLLTAVATRGAAPFRKVLTHGFVVDGLGRKMSKSVGNVISPEAVIGEFGADILRLWVAASDYRGDVRVSPEILSQLAEVYRKIRNTFRFMLGNLYDFDPDQDLLPFEGLEELDRWVLGRTRELVERVEAAYREHQYHVLYHAFHNFCTLDLSAFYLDVTKDRLYTEGASSPRRRAAQMTLYWVTSTLVRVVAPILVFTAEEVWRHLPHIAGDPDSVHLTEWPRLPGEWRDEARAQAWQQLLAVRDEVTRAVERARNDGLVAGSQDAVVTLTADPGLADTLAGLGTDLAELFLVAGVDLLRGRGPAGEVVVEVTRTAGGKCPRCWRYGPADEGVLCPRCAEVVAGGTAQ